MSNLSKQRTKIIVRIRNPKGEDNKKTNTTKTSLEDRKTTKSANKSTKTLANNKPKTTSKSKKDEPQSIKSSFNANASYTIFTSMEKSNICVVTNNPINGKLIQETFQSSSEIYDYSVNLMNDSSIFEYDSVYNEQHRLEQIYLEQIKEPIAEMLIGKNSCIIAFGPSEGGKSYTFRGGDKEKGIIDRAVDDLFNFVEINQQINQGKQNRSLNSFRLKVFIYHVFNDNIYDLFNSSVRQNPLKIEKSIDDETLDTYTSVIDLSEKDLKTRKDFVNCLNEALKVRKNQAQIMQINNLSQKSNLVISFILEKVTKFNDNFSKTNETTIEKFSQVDFVESASSQFGLPLNDIQKKKLPAADIETKGKVDNVNKLYNEGLDDSGNKIIEKTFNAICDNIIAANNNNSNSKTDTKLTLCLKPTLNRKSNIILIVCVLPNEKPPIYSSKSLKFGNWLRNQISNFESNQEYRYKNQNKNDSDVEVDPDIIEYTKGSKFQNIYRNNENQNEGDEIDRGQQRQQDTGIYKNTMSDYTEQKARKENINREYSYQNNYTNIRNNCHNDDEDLNINTNKRKNTNSYEYANEPSYKIQSDKMTNNYKKIQELDVSLRSFEGEKKEYNSINYSKVSSEKQKTSSINQNGNQSKLNERYHNYPLNTNNYNNTENIRSAVKEFSSSKNNFYEPQDLRQENMILKSDVIIYKEHNAQLIDHNQTLKAEVDNLNSKINFLTSENANLVQDKINKQQEIERLSTNIVRGGNTIFNTSASLNPEKSRLSLDLHFTLENKIRELESTNKTLFNEKQKFEIDYKVVSERYNELKQNYDTMENNFNNLKNKQIEEMDLIEDKLERMCRELEYIQKENYSMKSNEERIKNQFNNLERKYIKKNEKFNNLKESYDILLAKVRELENTVIR